MAGVYVFTDPTGSGAPITKWSSDMGEELDFMLDEFCIVLYSHHIKSIVIYTNIKPHFSYTDYPLLDEVFRAKVYAAADKFIDTRLQTADMAFAGRNSMTIIRVAKRLMGICRDYS